MIKNNTKVRNGGFTIVELLIVILVIGILAAITIVSYTGVNQKAIVASLQSDLSNSADNLNVYYAKYGTYPQSIDGNNCPAGLSSNSPYCLKFSGDNQLSCYAPESDKGFTLFAKNKQLYYMVTQDAPPAESGPILTSGGTLLSDNGCNHTRTFLKGTYYLTTAFSGTITVTINGAGGGGGSDFNCWTHSYGGPGGVGGNYSSLEYGGSIYLAAGGGGGGGAGNVGAPGGNGSAGTGAGAGAGGAGSAAASYGNDGWIYYQGAAGGTGGTGGGAAGGTGGTGGGTGGSGGQLIKSLIVGAGQSIKVVVGTGGPGVANGSLGLNGRDRCGEDGSAGQSGSVIISYFY